MRSHLTGSSMKLQLLTGYSIESIDARVLARVAELQRLARSFSGKGGDGEDSADDE